MPAASAEAAKDSPVSLVTGATGAAGEAVCRQLLAAGHRVIAVGRDDASLAAFLASLGSDRAQARAADLTDADAVRQLAEAVRGEHGRIDSLVHLVGGWRGGKGFTGQSAEDWKFLSTNLIDTLRLTTQAVHDDLVASPNGRAIIVSAKAAAKPTAANANYATAKAAAETWMLALADSFDRAQSRNKTEPTTQQAAAVILVITAIGDKPGFTSADQLAGHVVEAIQAPADTVNGQRIDAAPAAGTKA